MARTPGRAASGADSHHQAEWISCLSEAIGHAVRGNGSRTQRRLSPFQACLRSGLGSGMFGEPRGGSCAYEPPLWHQQLDVVFKGADGPGGGDLLPRDGSSCTTGSLAVRCPPEMRVGGAGYTNSCH